MFYTTTIKSAFILLILLLSIGWGFSQGDQLGSVGGCGYDSLLKTTGVSQEDITTQGRYISELIQNKKRAAAEIRSKYGFAASEENQVYRIPVVIHVLELPGRRGGVSDEVVMKSIEKTNGFFASTSVDLVEDKFSLAAAGNTGIEFHLARVSPEGIPTSGIIRTVMPDGHHRLQRQDMNFTYALNYSPVWDQTRYINIWVTPEGTTSGWRGVAVFPVNSRLDGLASGWARHDGMIVAAGSLNTYVLAHEIGHYLGLHHTFVGRSCSYDDFCDDTPNQNSTNTSGRCLVNAFSCREQSMSQNIMNYTNCGLVFTKCQAERMQTVLEYSPRRRALWIDSESRIVSGGAVENNAGFENKGTATRYIVTNPKYRGPGLLLINYGESPISSITMGYTVNGEAVTPDIELPTGAGYIVNEAAFPDIELVFNRPIEKYDRQNILGRNVVSYMLQEEGNYEFTLTIKKVNGVVDTEDTYSNNTWSSVFFLFKCYR